MAKYRIFFNGTQVDIDAERHNTYGEKNETMIQFTDKQGHVLASFKLSSLHGFIQTDALVNQQDAPQS